ncbi:MAG: acyltransferase [Lachnospiraceae bacterium]|jgi:acetyltransferase-like isoleucine patch superfamily enzyme|nr:acyltransferase [Lachnospiraceae bacterium]MEE3460936.1 acyltransferase [Lachnospiraceae bacterium]
MLGLIKKFILKNYNSIIKSQFNSAGKNVRIDLGMNLLNGKYVTVGDDCYFGPNCRIEAWDSYSDRKFTPQIIFGNDVRINSKCHIGSINSVVIGDNCLFGSNVMIIDHSHGRNLYEEMNIHPSERELFSKGPIEIGHNTWLCENVVVLPGVKIGCCCTIGANAVVTCDIPDYSVAVGNPARVVKIIKPSRS